MSLNQRVFITGYGALTASGETADENWETLLAGKTSIREISEWDLSSWTYRLGGEIAHLQPAKMLPDRKLMKVISRQDVFGIYAAMQAVEHSQLLPYRDSLNSADSFNEKTGVYVGAPGNKYYQQYDFLPLMSKTKGDMQAFAGQLFNEVHPMWLLRILPNNVLAYTGISYGFKGPNHNIVDHAVGGSQAIIEAYHAIQQGQAERAIVVGYDLGTEPQTLYYYEKLGVLSTKHLKPFDKAHDGTILAEGAAALVLESEASVQARQAKIYAELVGGLSQTENSGLFSLEAEGKRFANLLANTFETYQLDANDIAMVVAHGNGNPNSDDSEAKAIETIFGKKTVPVTAFKWAMGHTIAASGILDTVLATYALANRCIPGIANFNQATTAGEALDLSAASRPFLSDKQHVMVLNRGFGSINACIVIKSSP